MPGERADRLNALAAKAGARIAHVQQIILDQYRKPDEMQMLLDEMNAEIKNAGHAYDENCVRPFCVKYRRMFIDALAQSVAQGGV